MASSSSSGQESRTANPSPGGNDSSNTSTEYYHFAFKSPIYQQPHAVNQYDSSLRDSISSTRLPLHNTSREVDVTIPRSAMTRRQSHPQLWARAPAFVPRARSQQGAVAALEERRSPASDTYSTSTSPPGRLIYDNQVAGIPSHWVPVYGSGHGIFYEPVTKLFYNDGFPRPAMERRDGKVRPVDNSSLPHPIGLRRQDILHIHSPSLTEPINQAVENSPSAVERYYCRCVDAWLVNSHDCPDEDDAKEDSTRQVPALKVTPGAISPDDEIQPESSTRGLAGGDLCHRSWQQRHTYGYSERMPMLLPGVAETVVVPSWVDGGRQGWIRARRT